MARQDLTPRMHEIGRVAQGSFRHFSQPAGLGVGDDGPGGLLLPDLFAMGCVEYGLVGGKRPGDAGNDRLFFRCQRRSRPRGCPEDLVHQVTIVVELGAWAGPRTWRRSFRARSRERTPCRHTRDTWRHRASGRPFSAAAGPVPFRSCRAPAGFARWRTRGGRCVRRRDGSQVASAAGLSFRQRDFRLRLDLARGL